MRAGAAQGKASAKGKKTVAGNIKQKYIDVKRAQMNRKKASQQKLMLTTADAQTEVAPAPATTKNTSTGLPQMLSKQNSSDAS